MSEVRNVVREAGVPEELVEKAAEQLYNYFYEVKFEVLFDGHGNIVRVSLTPKLKPKTV